MGISSSDVYGSSSDSSISLFHNINDEVMKLPWYIVVNGKRIFEIKVKVKTEKLSM